MKEYIEPAILIQKFDCEEAICESAISYEIKTSVNGVEAKSYGTIDYADILK